MKKRQLAKPKEISRFSRKPVVRLHEQYADNLRLRAEIRRLAATRTTAMRQVDRS
jgi:hypothetical protein